MGRRTAPVYRPPAPGQRIRPLPATSSPIAVVAATVIAAFPGLVSTAVIGSPAIAILTDLAPTVAAVLRALLALPRLLALVVAPVVLADRARSRSRRS